MDELRAAAQDAVNQIRLMLTYNYEEDCGDPGCGDCRGRRPWDALKARLEKALEETK